MALTFHSFIPFYNQLLVLEGLEILANDMSLEVASSSLKVKVQILLSKSGMFKLFFFLIEFSKDLDVLPKYIYKRSFMKLTVISKSYYKNEGL